MDLNMRRIEKVQDKMRQAGFDYLILGPSSNMFYFSGLETTADERLQLVIVPASGQPAAVLPEMYQEKAAAVIGGRFPLLTWSDQQDPLELVKNTAPQRSARRIAVDDTLRAAHFLGIMEVFPGCAFEPASRVVDTLRVFKDDQELALMARSGDLADQVMEKVQAEIRPGLSEKELALFIEITFKQLSDDISFKPIVASGPHGASPHHSTGSRKFMQGDFIVVDCGGTVNGYCSDITRTFCLGKATGEMKKVYQAVLDANEKAFEAVDNGCTAEKADAAAREAITGAGYGPYFIHRTGHGIGLDVHEAPYLVEGNGAALLPGMVFSIEPGIYLPGNFGVRIEDVVAVTGNGARRLNSFNRDLVEL
jgi:Xaa-Pro dipeptidase